MLTKKHVCLSVIFFLTSELFLTGYPPQDLINRSDFHEKINFLKKKLLKITKNQQTILMLNIPQRKKGKIFNVLLLLKNGSVVYKKKNLYFQTMAYLMKKDTFQLKKLIHLFFQFKKRRIKFLICEEMWSDEFIKKNKSIRPDLLDCY